MPLIAITRLRVRAWWYLPGFFVQTLRAAAQARRAEGSLAVAVLREAHRTFWTCTVWTDEQAMRAFLAADPHRQAMRKLAEWCDEASVAHWLQAAPEPPSWEEAYQRMQRDGRASRVDHPSEAQRAYRIPAPRLRRRGMLRFK